jgi:branched-chain amino acid transport system substrate-binding protein
MATRQIQTIMSSTARTKVAGSAIFSTCVKSNVGVALLGILAFACHAAAQEASPPPKPYAAIDRQAINYSGPDREVTRDLPGQEIKIGILIPLQGVRKAEGQAILQAAQWAIEDESASPLPEGRRLALVARDETGLWGRASSELARLVVDDNAVALVTSTNGSAAHLAEQVGNRLGVPVLALSTDSSTTQINIPWFFRLAPDDAEQARVFAEDLYRRRGFERIALVTERDHDGRVGGEEFEKAAQRLQMPAPTRVEVDLARGDWDQVSAKIAESQPQAVILWIGPEAAARLLEHSESHLSGTPVYACRKALSEPFLSLAAQDTGGSIWLVAPSGERSTARREFSQRYRTRTGYAPSPAAAEAYDAVRLIAAGVRRAGPNRARLRDELVKVSAFSGASGIISFDGAGNNQADVALVKLGE